MKVKTEINLNYAPVRKKWEGEITIKLPKGKEHYLHELFIDEDVFVLGDKLSIYWGVSKTDEQIRERTECYLFDKDKDVKEILTELEEILLKEVEKIKSVYKENLALIEQGQKKEIQFEF